MRLRRCGVVRWWSVRRLPVGGVHFAIGGLEYVTDRLAEKVADEISSVQAVILVEQPLIQAQAKDYVRQSQERLIGVPILQRMNAQHTETETEQRLVSLLENWRHYSHAEQGYGPGNVVNLLRLLRGQLRGLDLSRLTIRQAYLADVEAQGASLAGAHLANTALAEAFDFPGSVALSGDGATLAAGTSTGQVCLWRIADRTPVWAAQGQEGPLCTPKRNQAQENATTIRSQTILQAPAWAPTATMTTLTTAWHGSGRETESLLEAVAHNCGCELGASGPRITCGAHQMLVDDQRALNGLLFGRFLAARLIREEMGAA